MTDSGGRHAIWLALVAACRAHPTPQQAVRAALSAVEVEQVRQLHSTQELSEWGLGFDAAQRELAERLLRAVLEPPPA
jgi:hypothetical protein